MPALPNVQPSREGHVVPEDGLGLGWREGAKEGQPAGPPGADPTKCWLKYPHVSEESQCPPLESSRTRKDGNHIQAWRMMKAFFNKIIL